MARQFSLIAQIPPVALLAPATDAAGRTSAYVSLRNCLKAFIVCEVNQGNAAQVTFTPLQATDVSGTGSKAMTAMPVSLVADTSVSDAFVAQAAAANFQTSATLKNKLVVFEIVPESCMDVTNAFDCIAIQTSSSNAGNITDARIHILGAYQQATPPSALIN